MLEALKAMLSAMPNLKTRNAIEAVMLAEKALIKAEGSAE